MEYKKELKSLCKDIVSRPKDLPEAFFKVLVMLVPVILYVVFVYVDDENGKRVFNPSGPAEHAAVLVFSYVSVISVILAMLWLSILAESGKLDPATTLISEFLGFPVEGPRLRKMRSLSKYLAHQTPSLAWITDQLRVVREIELHASQVEASNPRFLARKVAARRLRSYLDGTHRFNSYLRSESAYAEAAAHARSILESKSPGLEMDDTLVYFSVSGALNSMFESVLVSAHRVAGPDPVAEDPTWENHWYQYRPNGQRYDFAALVCAPAWMHKASMGHVSEREPDYMFRLTDPAPASSTFRDTIANLWDDDRWGMYHQPAKLVKAARGLDRNRRDGAEHWIP